MTYQGAIDELKSLENNESMPDWFKPALKKVRETMEMDARESIHGEWIPKERPTDEEFCSLYIDIVCSECGYVGSECFAYGYELNEIDMKKVRDHTKELDLNFCPCCGCSMDKGGE